MAVHTWRGAVEVGSRARLGGVGRKKYKGAGHDMRLASFFLRVKKYQNDNISSKK